MNAMVEEIERSAEVISLGPDMSILQPIQGTAPEMPGDLFGGLWPVLEEIAQAKGSATDFAALSFLSCAAAAIGGKRKVEAYAGSGWTEPSIIWAMCVGAPSTNKSPPMAAMVTPLQAIEDRHAIEHDDAMKEHKAACDLAKIEHDAWQTDARKAIKEGRDAPEQAESATAPDTPIRFRHVVKDSTPEKVAEILSGNPHGLLMFRDELAGWLQSFDRYAPGGRTQWLEAYGGGPLTVDRKGGGTTFVPYNGVSVLGSIQPDRLRSFVLSGDDDGLAARFMYGWPAPVGFTPPRPVKGSGRIAQIYEELSALPWGFGLNAENQAIVIPFSSSASDVYTAWQTGRSSEDSEFGGPLYQGLVGKTRGLVPRLALIGELVAWAQRGGSEPQEIGAERVAAAIEFVEQYAMPSALRVFGDAVMPEADRNARILAKYIRREGLRSINLREFERSRKSDLPTMNKREKLEAAVSTLVEAGWLSPSPTRQGSTPGRKSTDYRINPQVLEG